MNSSKKILFCANDPGGGNAILPVVQTLLKRGNTCEGLLTGPAREIFTRAGVPFQDAEELEDSALESIVGTYAPDLLLAGGSVGATVDKRVLRFFQSRKLPSVYVLDFWNYYGNRFAQAREDSTHLPTRICVVDERMKREVIHEGVPAGRLVETGNPYFDHFTDGITSDQEDRSLALFISQPIKKDTQHKASITRGFNEYSALDGVIRSLLPEMKLSIRLHPRDEKKKFTAYLNDRITISVETTLEEALSKAGLVIGMFSPVLMQGALAGKPTISFQPNMKGEDPLPTNALGITQAARNENELRALIEKYQQGQFPKPKEKVENLWPKGATERVVAVIDALSD